MSNLYSQFSYINQFFYQWILQLTKISILLFYTSLAQIRYFHRAAYSLIGISAVFALACTFVEIFQCSPVAKSVYGSLVAGKCIAQAHFFIVSGYVNLILDIAVLGLPMPLLWRLQAPIRQRVALIGIFCIGILSVGSVLCLGEHSQIANSEQCLYFEHCASHYLVPRVWRWKQEQP